MASIVTNLTCELTAPVSVVFLPGNMFSMDNGGNIINVFVVQNGEPVALGGSVSANVIRSDGTTVAITGALEGNKAYIILPQACYAVPGIIHIVMKITEGTTITTIAAVTANVYQSSTDAVVDRGTLVPSIAALIEAIEDAVDSIPVDYSGLLATLAADYSTSKTYKVGDYAWYGGVLKRCIVAITTAESYTAAHWTNAVIGDDLSALKSAIKYIKGSTATSYGVNFFDPFALIENTDLGTNGVAVYSALYDVTDFIDIGNNTKFTFKLFDYAGAVSFLVYQYSSNSEASFIKRTSNSSYLPGRTFNFDSSTKYIRFRVEKSAANHINPYAIMCVWGEATITDFIPFYTANDKTARSEVANKANTSGTVFNYNRTDVPSDANNVAVNSIYYIQTNDTIAHLPDAITGVFQAGWLETVVRSSNNTLQKFYPLAIVGVFYTRIKKDGTWGNWQEFSSLVKGALANVYANETYNLGDYAQSNGKLYKSNVYIPTAEAFDSDHWDQIAVLNELHRIEQEMCNTSCLSMFEKIGCIGDSFTAGYLYNKNNVEPDYVPDGSYPAISYPAVLGRLYGISTINFGKAGATTGSWITDKLPSVLAAEQQQLYIIALGLNDHTQSVPIADAIANVKTIVDAISSYAPLAKFVIVKSLWVLRAGDHATHPYGVTGYYTYISQLAEAISEYYDFPYIETMGDPFFCGKAYVDGLHGFHPTAPLYAGIAKRLGQLLDKCIINNPDYFFNFYIPNN